MTGLRSVMTHRFSDVPDVKIQRSKFNRSHGYKTTFDAGYLVPVLVDEVLPGDTFKVNMTAIARLSTPIKPIMDNMYLDTFFFAVPIRLLWDNWKKFNGEQTDPGDSTAFTIPTMESTAGTGYAVGSLHDYFGIPTGVAGLTHSSLFHRAYNLIFNEWFRDENIIDSVVVDKDNGTDDPADYVLLRRCKRHDYFTSCLPWPQKGDSVALPLSGNADVITNDGAISMYTQTDPTNYWLTIDGNDGGLEMSTVPGGGNARFGDYTGLECDLTTVTAATINELRQAFQIQRLLERDARGGTRYIEIIRSHFGVVSPDARMQRPEYLGGGSSAIRVNPVVQNSVTATTPQGNLAAVGIVNARHGFVKSFTEHCILMGIVNVRADLTYDKGLDRMFSRETRWDFYWPTLSHLGEQAVLKKEIYCDASATDDEVFGYQERYAEYRYKPSKITGLFRTAAAGGLDVWHLCQELVAAPEVNDGTFILEDPPVDRVIATPAEPHFYFDSYFDMVCVRPMPVYSAPGLIDHL